MGALLQPGVHGRCGGRKNGLFSHFPPPRSTSSIVVPVYQNRAAKSIAKMPRKRASNKGFLAPKPPRRRGGFGLPERVRGIEPLSPPWQGGVLPLYDTRSNDRRYSTRKTEPGQPGGEDYSRTMHTSQNTIDGRSGVDTAAWTSCMSQNKSTHGVENGVWETFAAHNISMEGLPLLPAGDACGKIPAWHTYLCTAP